MKKILFLIMAICSTIVATAQSTDQISAILHHGDEVSVFTGNTAFQKAYAAAVDGDVINLSQGVFYTIETMNKSLRIYGAGFEDNAETNTAITKINGDVKLEDSEKTIDGFVLEGVKIEGYFAFNANTKNALIQKCYMTELRFNYDTENITVRQCRITGSIDGCKKVAKGLLISNCYVWDVINHFDPASFVNIDHSFMGLMYWYKDREYAQFLWTNCIINDRRGGNGGNYVPTANAATLKNCIMLSSWTYDDGIIENCFYPAVADVFADAENVEYTETRTFELKDPETYKGTDGTPIGPSGGAGWNKVPSHPYIKNLSATTSGTNLNVSYESGVK